MIVRNSLLTMAAGVAMLFIGCRKNVETPAEAITSSSVSSDANAADATIETAPPSWTSVVTNVNSNCAGYWQGVPSLYSQTTKTYPLIVFIHGIGELGTSITRMNCCGLPNHLYNKKFPANFNIAGQNSSFLVIAPQFKVRPTAADLQSVIDYARGRWRVDASRIYVTGLSMGGGTTWDWSAVYGEKAAAIVPVCGGTAPTSSLTQKIASKNLAIWGLYSSIDAVVPVQWGRDFFTWIDQYNTAYASKTKLTIWNDVDHNYTWGRAFDPKTKVDGYSIYEWMLLWKRSSTGSVSSSGTSQPAPIPEPEPIPKPSGNIAPVARAGADQSVPSSWNWFPNINANTSTDADGYIAKFLWTQVSGPNNAVIVNPNTGSTKVTGWTVGTYVFRVVVTDDKGATSTDDVAITVTGTATTPTSPTTTPSTTNPDPSNIPPVARAGADQSVPKSWNWLPALNANASTDADGYVAKITWKQVSGPTTATIATPNTGKSSISGLGVGSYLFRAAVTDNKGAIAYDDVVITVTNN